MSSEITKIKGKKRIKNQPALHDEVKTSKHLSLTPSSWDKLKKIAGDRGISVSEVIERWVRNIEGD